MGVCTGTFQLPNGSPVANGLYQFKLSQDALQYGTANIAPTLISGNLDSSGNLTATFLFNDVLTTTAGFVTTYQLTVKDKNGGQAWNESYFFTGTAANLNLYPPSGVGTVPSTSAVGVGQALLGNVSGVVTATVSAILMNVEMTLTGNTTLALATPPAYLNGSIITFKIRQDASGSHTFTWPANTINPMGVAPGQAQTSYQIFYWAGGTMAAVGPGLLNP